MSEAKVVICPYCGETQAAGDQCRECGGLFDALSRQATHNEMGPWFIYDRDRPHRPGCSYETLARLIERAIVTKYSIVRGPTTKQYWTVARRIPGVAHLLGYCHACDARVEPTEHGCPSCGVPFGAYLDRNYLGLPEVRPLPWEAPGDPDHGEAGQSATGPMAVATAPAGTGISSFAADEELLGGGPAAGIAAREAMGVEPSYGVASAPGEWEAARLAAAPVADPSTHGEWLSSPAVRAMQRRLARQERTIRMLTVLVLLVAVGGAAFAVVIAQRAGPEESDAGTPVSGRVDGTTPAAADGTADDGAGDTLNEDDPAATPPAVNEEPGVPPGSPSSPDATPVETSPERRQAMELVTRAGDASRPLEERIADYEQALTLLQPLRAAAGDNAALGTLVTTIETELERLRLRRDYFKGSD